MNLDQVKKQLNKFYAEKAKIEEKKQAKIEELELKKKETLKVFDDKLADVQKKIKTFEAQKSGMEKLMKQLEDMEKSTDNLFTEKKKEEVPVFEEPVFHNTWEGE